MNILLYTGNLDFTVILILKKLGPKHAENPEAPRESGISFTPAPASSTSKPLFITCESPYHGEGAPTWGEVKSK
jgi:hypothetical protein